MIHNIPMMIGLQISTEMFPNLTQQMWIQFQVKSNYSIKGVHHKSNLNIYEECVYTLHMAHGPVYLASMFISNELVFSPSFPLTCFCP